MEIDENLENPIGGYIHRVPGTNIPDGVCDGTVRYRIFNYMPLPIPEEALEPGASFTLHNDFPCLPPHVMMLLDTTVNRRSYDDPSRVYGTDLPKVLALKGITINAAYQYFKEDRKGSITEGKLADLVVLDANPMTVDSNSLFDIQVLETIKEGKTVLSIKRLYPSHRLQNICY